MIIQAGSSIVNPLANRAVKEVVGKAKDDSTDAPDVMRNSTPIPIQDYPYEMEVEGTFENNYRTEFSDTDEVDLLEEIPLRATRSTRSSSRLKDPQPSEDEDWMPEKVKVVRKTGVRRRPNIKKASKTLPELVDHDEEEEEIN